MKNDGNNESEDRRIAILFGVSLFCNKTSAEENGKCELEECTEFDVDLPDWCSAIDLEGFEPGRQNHKNEKIAKE